MESGGTKSKLVSMDAGCSSLWQYHLHFPELRRLVIDDSFARGWGGGCQGSPYRMTFRYRVCRVARTLARHYADHITQPTASPVYVFTNSIFAFVTLCKYCHQPPDIKLAPCSIYSVFSVFSFLAAHIIQFYLLLQFNSRLALNHLKGNTE